MLQEQGYGREPADAFRPSDLKKVREAMVARQWSRNYINSQVNRIKRMFGYATEEDLVPGTVYHALLAVKGLRKGTLGVRETKKVRPVPGKHLGFPDRAQYSCQFVIILGPYEFMQDEGENNCVRGRMNGELLEITDHIGLDHADAVC